MSRTTQLEVVNMLGHDSQNFTIYELIAEFGVDEAGNKLALLVGYLLQLKGEGAGSIDEASARLVTVEDLLLGVEVLKAFHLAKHREIVGRKVEVNLTGLVRQ